jgi:hypothetical protein
MTKQSDQEKEALYAVTNAQTDIASNRLSFLGVSQLNLAETQEQARLEEVYQEAATNLQRIRTLEQEPERREAARILNGRADEMNDARERGKNQARTEIQEAKRGTTILF